MTIRKAEEKDITRIIELLGQVLQIHADIRPDIFIPGMLPVVSAFTGSTISISRQISASTVHFLFFFIRSPPFMFEPYIKHDQNDSHKNCINDCTYRFVCLLL